MWLYLTAQRYEEIVKIEGITANYRGEYSYITIFYLGDRRHTIEFTEENACRRFFDSIKVNLSNSNKILRYGEIEDL